VTGGWSTHVTNAGGNPVVGHPLNSADRASDSSGAAHRFYEPFCPTCNQAPGSPCLNIRSWHPLPHPHPARADAIVHALRAELRYLRAAAGEVVTGFDGYVDTDELDPLSAAVTALRAALR
jgi:hypothetical protein